MDVAETARFLVAAIALLGSPGPAIAALLAVGRAEGWAGGLRFFAGLQIGLASAAAISVVGLFVVISTFSGGTLWHEDRRDDILALSRL